jgi:hypothetical protein
MCLHIAASVSPCALRYADSIPENPTKYLQIRLETGKWEPQGRFDLEHYITG